MVEYATKSDIEKVVGTAVTKAVGDLSEIIQSFAQNVDEQFDSLADDVRKLDDRYDKLINTLDNFLKRLDEIEIENAARDAQIARIERKVEHIAAKTGVNF